MLPVVPAPAVALLRRQGGLARRQDLARCGLTRWRLDRLLDAGALRLVAGDVLSARTAAVAGADAAARIGLVGLGDLRRACAALPSGRQRSRVARVLRLVDPLSGSVLESVCRVLLAEAGLPRPLTQFEVRRSDGRLLCRVDVAWVEHRLVVETDGFGFHADRERYRTDRRRTNALVLDGWRVLRFSWEDVVHHPEEVVEAVRAALLHTS